MGFSANAERRAGKLKTAMRDNARISVIIPTLDEAENIVEVIYKLKRAGCHNILVVDGNSHDNTVERARISGAKVILQNGKGKGGALRQAFENGSIDGDMVLILDADGSMDPDEVPLFTEALKPGVDIVKGSRFLPGGQSEDITAMRRVGNKILVGLLNFICLTNYTDLCYGYMIFKRKALTRLSQHLKSQNFEIETEICLKAKELGLNVREIPSTEHPRNYGNSKLSTFKDGFRILMVILRESLIKTN
jgi:glycosyltransferase involved in cell wall biosynthesis